jgi:hypothetical protein
VLGKGTGIGIIQQMSERNSNASFPLQGTGAIVRGPYVRSRHRYVGHRLYPGRTAASSTVPSWGF